ncbi:unnamed protein product [Lupinus luteus]|uniref:Uncharacterized protein n=1 Tax=Lupinus luteus TaxID=3873 RepID=A0AAV1WQG9_LUPLU
MLVGGIRDFFMDHGAAHYLSLEEEAEGEDANFISAGEQTIGVADGVEMMDAPFSGPPIQQHGFNFTYQLESGNGGDLPSSGEVKFTL